VAEVVPVPAASLEEAHTGGHEALSFASLLQFLSPDAAKDLVVKEKAVLLDVREEYEFAEVRNC